MWAFLTYEEYLAMCGGQFLGGLLGIALVAAGIYYLIKAVLFLLPFFFVILMCYFIFNAGRVGVKKILLALRNALIFLLITLVVGAVFIGIAALLADNDHKILAVIFALPGIAIAFLGVLALLPIVFICIGSEEKDPDKLFPVLLLLAFFSEKIFSFFIWFIQDYIFLYIPSNIADMIPVTLTLLTILFIIQKRKCSVSKSLLIGFMPLVSVFVFYFFSIFRKNSVITLSLASYAITVLSYATSFVLPSLFLGLAIKKQNELDTKPDKLFPLVLLIFFASRITLSFIITSENIVKILSLIRLFLIVFIVMLILIKKPCLSKALLIGIIPVALNITFFTSYNFNFDYSSIRIAGQILQDKDKSLYFLKFNGVQHLNNLLTYELPAIITWSFTALFERIKYCKY